MRIFLYFRYPFDDLRVFLKRWEEMVAWSWKATSVQCASSLICLFYSWKKFQKYFPNDVKQTMAEVNKAVILRRDLFPLCFCLCW